MQNAFAPKFSSKEIDMLLTLVRIKCLRLKICDLNLDYLEVSTFKYQRQFKQICIKYQFLQPYTEDFVHIEQVIGHIAEQGAWYCIRNKFLVRTHHAIMIIVRTMSQILGIEAQKSS